MIEIIDGQTGERKFVPCENRENSLPDRNWLSNLSDFSGFPNGILIAISDRLEESISGPSKISLKEFSEQLEELMGNLLKISPVKSINAAHGLAPIESIENAAYLLGQLSFVQLLASQAAERRTDPDERDASNRSLNISERIVDPLPPHFKKLMSFKLPADEQLW